MAKKQFTASMDSLFGETSMEETEQGLSLFPDKGERAKSIKSKGANKGFSSQLDAFLADAFETEEKENPTSKEPRKIRARPRLSGLDLLIRKTADAPAASRLKAPDKRRLTLAFNKAQLAKLKEIASDEGIFLKDLINQLIERYLEQHDK